MSQRYEDLAAARELNQALRKLINTVRTADFNGVDLATAIVQIRSVDAELANHVVPKLRTQSTVDYATRCEGSDTELLKCGPPRAIEGAEPAEFFPYSPIMGPLNPISPPAKMVKVAVGDHFEVHGEVVFPAAFNGPPGCVHGGVLAELFDELLGVVGVVNGLGGFTGTLTVVYRSPTPLHSLLTFRSWIDRVDGRKIFSVAEIHCGERLCASANAIFIQPEPRGEQVR